MFVTGPLRGDQVVCPVLHAEELFLELGSCPVAVMLVRFTMNGEGLQISVLGRMEVEHELMSARSSRAPMPL